MAKYYLFDIMDYREILIPEKTSIKVGRGVGCDYRTLVKFSGISLEQFSIRNGDDLSIYVTNLDAQVSIYAGTDEVPFDREITNREPVFVGEYLTVNQDYQFKILSENDYFKMRECGIPGRS